MGKSGYTLEKWQFAANMDRFLYKLCACFPSSRTIKIELDFSMAPKSLRYLVLALLAAAATSAVASAATPLPMQSEGPGHHILGLDISRYQHAGSKPINFATIAAAGVNFLWINGGNTLSDADTLAAIYYRSDRQVAQAAGIYTGFYYYAHLPNTSKQSVIIANAHNQANKVVNRINLDGGLNELDMPIALDLETTCTKKVVFGICAHSLSPQESTLWVTEWDKVIRQATGRTPVIYSFRSLLHGTLGKATSLRDNPLWIATAGVNPAILGSQPSLLKTGCSTNIWTNPECQTQWSFWQYSSGGNGRKYGIAQGQLDLDIFSGTPEDFANFQATGLQVPLMTVTTTIMLPQETPSSEPTTPQAITP